MADMFGKDMITTQELNVDEIAHVIKVAERLRHLRQRGKLPPKILERKNFFMLFWAPSTRTRAAFEGGMELLGGHASYIDIATTRIKTGEYLSDVVRMYDVYGDGLGVRILDDAIDFLYGEGRKIVKHVARVVKIPLINMGCCTYHPTQALGDMMTIKRKLGNLRKKKYVITWAYSSKLRGRGSTQEELLISTRLGMDVVLAHPRGFEIDPRILDAAKKNTKDSGGSLETSQDFKEALKNADVVFPRGWVTSKLSSVGQTAFGIDNEIRIHDRYREWRLEQKHVDDLMNKGAIVTHVLPVFREEEATSEVLEGPNSVIFEQAEDSLYSKMAVLTLVMGSDTKLGLAHKS